MRFAPKPSNKQRIQYNGRPHIIPIVEIPDVQQDDDNSPRMDLALSSPTPVLSETHKPPTSQALVHSLQVCWGGGGVVSYFPYLLRHSPEFHNLNNAVKPAHSETATARNFFRCREAVSFPYRYLKLKIVVTVTVFRYRQGFVLSRFRLRQVSLYLVQSRNCEPLHYVNS